MSAKTHASPDWPTALRCASIVAAQHLMPAETLFRKTRGSEEEAKARHEFAYVLHIGCEVSLNRVAALLKRDRSTVSHSVRVVEEGLSDAGREARMERLVQLAREAVALGALQDELSAKLEARENAKSERRR